MSSFAVELTMFCTSEKYSEGFNNFLRPADIRNCWRELEEGTYYFLHMNKILQRVCYQSSCGMWPAPSISLTFITSGFPFWNSSATDWGRYLSDIPQATNIGLSQLKLYCAGLHHFARETSVWRFNISNVIIINHKHETTFFVIGYQKHFFSSFYQHYWTPWCV